MISYGDVLAYVCRQSPVRCRDDSPDNYGTCTPVRPHERQLMRPWLVERVDSGQVPGLEWHKRSENLIRIPWKHASRHGWSEGEDASLFKQWAVHTGKKNMFFISQGRGEV